MEKLITHVLEERRNGSKIVRNYFMNKEAVNYMTLAHSYFTRAERKRAKRINKTK